MPELGGTPTTDFRDDTGAPPRPSAGDVTARRRPAPGRSAFSDTTTTRAAHVDTALSFTGTVEQPAGSNAGPAVESFLAHVGLGPGHPWCAAFTSYVLDAAGAVRPAVRDARSRMFAREQSVPAADVYGGHYNPQRGDLAVYRWSKYTGHVGIVTGRDGRRLGTVSGNTSGPDGQPDGVWRKTRHLVPTNRYAPDLYTPVRY